MFENILSEIANLTPIWIYITIFLFAYAENLFPPSPSDLIVVVGGSLVGTNVLSFFPLLIFSTGGSVAGFLTAFALGWQFDKKLLHSGKIKFIKVESVEKVENAFRKYGYFLIVANRFLPGTRAVISFFAGMSRLDVHKTMWLSTISSLLWNFILIYSGMMFGENIAGVDKYLSTYSNIVVTISVLIVVGLVIKYFLVKKKST